MRRAQGYPASTSGHPPFLFFLFLVALAPGSLRGQELVPPSEEEIRAARNAPLFSHHPVLPMTLKADFSAIRRHDRSEDSEERPALLRWRTDSGATDSLEIQIQTRGNFRLQRRNCNFPPLRLNLKKKATEGTVFQGQDKLKLVVTCKTGGESWEQFVVVEYLIYRTLNLLTDRSFRARLARVSYVDTGGDDDPFTRYAVLLEDDDAMAVRQGGGKMDWTSGQLHPRHLEPYHSVLVEVFQFMIGNTDWSGVEMHNMELVRDSLNRYSTVPFDFDFSGMVDARYAAPDPSLRIRRVRQRLFRGFCPEGLPRPESVYDSVFARYREKKDEIYQLWRSQEGLSRDRMEDSLAYLDEFFRMLDDPDRIQSMMMRDCRRVPGAP